MAVSVNPLLVSSATGVPEIAPVAGSKANPAGRAGLIPKDDTEPPVLVTTVVVIAEPRVMLWFAPTEIDMTGEP